MEASLTGCNWHSKWAREFSFSERSPGVVTNTGGCPSASGDIGSGSLPRPSSSAIFSIPFCMVFGNWDSRIMLRFPTITTKTVSWCIDSKHENEYVLKSHLHIKASHLWLPLHNHLKHGKSKLQHPLGMLETSPRSQSQSHKRSWFESLPSAFCHLWTILPVWFLGFSKRKNASRSIFYTKILMNFLYLELGIICWSQPGFKVKTFSFSKVSIL